VLLPPQCSLQNENVSSEQNAERSKKWSMLENRTPELTPHLETGDFRNRTVGSCAWWLQALPTWPHQPLSLLLRAKLWLSFMSQYMVFPCTQNAFPSLVTGQSSLTPEHPNCKSLRLFVASYPLSQHTSDLILAQIVMRSFNQVPQSSSCYHLDGLVFQHGSFLSLLWCSALRGHQVINYRRIYYSYSKYLLQTAISASNIVLIILWFLQHCRCAIICCVYTILCYILHSMPTCTYFICTHSILTWDSPSMCYIVIYLFLSLSPN
jgi:hypothetical protein